MILFCATETISTLNPSFVSANSYHYVDMTVTISIILAVSAIISPIVTSICSSRLKYRKRKEELESKHKTMILLHKQKVFEEYLLEAGKAIGDRLSGPSKEYYSSYYIALASAPRDIRHKMNYVNESLTSGNYEDAASEIESVSAAINNYTETL